MTPVIDGFECLRIPHPEEIKLGTKPGLDEQRAGEWSYFIAGAIQEARKAKQFDSAGRFETVLPCLDLDIEKENQIINQVLAGTGWSGHIRKEAYVRKGWFWQRINDERIVMALTPESNDCDSHNLSPRSISLAA